MTLSGATVPLTAGEIDRVWRYDSETGRLYWRTSPCNSVPAGALAGDVSEEGYIRINYQYRRYMAHWLVWTLLKGAWPTSLIDHRDNDGTNNREDNLREATKIRNAANRRRGLGDNLRGARFRYDRGTWIAVLKKTYLGSFPDEQSAHEAWKKAALREYGEFARFD